MRFLNQCGPANCPLTASHTASLFSSGTERVRKRIWRVQPWGSSSPFRTNLFPQSTSRKSCKGYSLPCRLCSLQESESFVTILIIALSAANKGRGHPGLPWQENCRVAGWPSMQDTNVCLRVPWTVNYKMQFILLRVRGDSFSARTGKRTLTSQYIVLMRFYPCTKKTSAWGLSHRHQVELRCTLYVNAISFVPLSPKSNVLMT